MAQPLKSLKSFILAIVMKITSRLNGLYLEQGSSPSTEPTTTNEEKPQVSTDQLNNGEDVKPILILEIGRLQVFGYQTQVAWSAGLIPSRIYWQTKHGNEVFGPFQSIYEAVNDYAYMERELLLLTESERRNKDIIKVNFKAKRKIV